MFDSTDMEKGSESRNEDPFCYNRGVEPSEHLRQLAESLDLALKTRGLSLKEFAAELQCSEAELENIRRMESDPPYSLAMKIMAALQTPAPVADETSRLSRHESKLDSLINTRIREHTPDPTIPYLSAVSKDRLAEAGKNVGRIIISVLESQETGND